MRTARNWASIAGACDNAIVAAREHTCRHWGPELTLRALTVGASGAHRHPTQARWAKSPTPGCSGMRAFGRSSTGIAVGRRSAGRGWVAADGRGDAGHGRRDARASRHGRARGARSTPRARGPMPGRPTGVSASGLTALPGNLDGISARKAVAARHHRASRGKSERPTCGLRDRNWRAAPHPLLIPHSSGLAQSTLPARRSPWGRPQKEGPQSSELGHSTRRPAGGAARSSRPPV